MEDILIVKFNGKEFVIKNKMDLIKTLMSFEVLYRSLINKTYMIENEKEKKYSYKYLEV